MDQNYILCNLNIENARMAQLIVDFGMFLLIWLVQLIIYPVLLYMNEQELNRWHVKYTRIIVYFVLPLMGVQLAFLLYELSSFPDVSTLTMAFFVFIAWVITFFYAIPLHRKVVVEDDTLFVRQQLVKINWYRTAAWTATFLVSVYRVVNGH